MTWIRSLPAKSLLALALLMTFASLALAQAPASPEQLCEAAEPAPLTMMQFAQAEQVLEPGVDYRAILCTGAGAITIDLYEKLTPITVNNFVFLARQGYYDSSTFHRVIPNFMAQGGDPTGSGRGGPGYQFGDEPVGFLTFDRPGLLAMANAGPGTNGGQFFITTVPTPHLNYKHTIFGDVLAGQAAVEAIRERDPQTASSPGEALRTVLIISDSSALDIDETARPPAAEAEVISAFEGFTAALPPELPLDAERSGNFSTADLAKTVTDELQAGFAAFADAYGHQYRQRMQITNGDCDASVFFSHLGYWVDVYADAAAASAALQDDFMQQWLDSYGFAHDGAPSAAYRRSAETCDGKAGAELLTLYTRGRFLVTIDVLVAEGSFDAGAGARYSE